MAEEISNSGLELGGKLTKRPKISGQIGLHFDAEKLHSIKLDYISIQIGNCGLCLGGNMPHKCGQNECEVRHKMASILVEICHVNLNKMAMKIVVKWL